MDIKLIAIGSRIMGDDGIAIAAAESLQQELIEQGIQVVIGETDVEFCLCCIDKEDDLIIVDAALSGREPGSVWQLPLCVAMQNSKRKYYQHDTDLLDALQRKGLQPSGLLICIEAAEVMQRWGLSEALQGQLPRICEDIKRIICEYRGEWKNA